MSLKGAVAKGLTCWFFAGIIVTILSVLFALLTGGLIGVFQEVIVDVVLQPLFFPFDLIVGWALNPVAVILQILFFIFLLYFSEKNDSLSLSDKKCLIAHELQPGELEGKNLT